MPKLGMEPIRREALVRATIAEVGLQGSLDVTVSQIARRAGMSSALAHHYFGGKDQIFLAAMRQILRDYGTSTRKALARARTPRARVEAILEESFAAPNFHTEVIAAWLSFYVHAQTAPEAHRLLEVYRRRLHSNLTHALRPLTGRAAPGQARILGALIDGIYIRSALAQPAPDRGEALEQLMHVLQLLLAEGRT